LAIKESDIVEMTNSLIEGSSLENFKPFWYPLYFLKLTLKGKKRAVWLDGRKGKEVRM